MTTFIARRLLQLIPILLGVSILVFAWTRALPGGPAQSLLGERASPEAVERFRRAYGLDRPIIVQYGTYLKQVVTLDFGQSIKTRRPVTTELKDKFTATVELAMAALIFAVGVGLPLGFLAAKRQGSFVDNFLVAFSLLGVSIPVFFLAYMLKYAFAVKLAWLPSVGRISPTQELDRITGFYLLDSIITWNWSAFWDATQHLILPAIALGSIPLAIIARITRASVLEVSNEDYVRTARAKGMSGKVIDRRHVLRNAMLPISTVIGLQVGLLLSGAVLTETVFSWPGMGRLMSEAIFNRDYPVLQAGVLFLALVFVLVNLAVDVGYAIFDPRLRTK